MIERTVVNYKKTTPVVSNLNEKGDLSFQGNCGGSHVENHLSYSPFQNMGLLFTSHISTSRNYADIPEWKYEREISTYFEGGIGYYKTLQSNLKIEGYLGYGQGSVNSSVTNNFNEGFLFFVEPISIERTLFYSKFNRKYFQINIVSIPNDKFQLYTGFKLEQNSYQGYDLLYSHNFVDPFVTDQYIYIENGNASVNNFAFFLANMVHFGNNFSVSLHTTFYNITSKDLTFNNDPIIGISAFLNFENVLNSKRN